MKSLKLMVAVALAMISTVASAQSDFFLYGKNNVSVGYATLSAKNSDEPLRGGRISYTRIFELNEYVPVFLETGGQVQYATVSENEIFVSSGACDDLGDILELFDQDNTVMVIEPAYPEYVDTNILAGRNIVHLNANEENGFLPMPDNNTTADIIYICSPNNPTGAAYNKHQLQEWIDFANEIGAVILFDAAYEIFIEDSSLPHSIFELDGADRCAIEICSLSKTAGFTGTRLGYTVVPHDLVRGGMNLNEMWSRNRETRTNGISYILQKGAAAVFTAEGQNQIRKNIRVYKENAAAFTKALDKVGVWYCGGTNSPYIWMKCPDGMSGWEFFDYLINEIQVVGIPGDGFGECGKGYFRFSAFGSPEDTKEAADRLCKLLKKE